MITLVVGIVSVLDVKILLRRENCKNKKPKEPRRLIQIKLKKKHYQTLHRVIRIKCNRKVTKW